MMDVQEKTDSMLSPYRVLDLTDEKGFFCSKLLADMGADVIQVEKPGGSLARNIGPFYHDTADPEKSLYWFAYNANKRGITLDIENREGQEIFRKLVKTSDVVIESFTPGYMRKLGLDYESLAGINPGIIVCSIAPFGQTGPYKHYKGSDIVADAMSGYMYLNGDADRPPIRISFPQAYNTAAGEACFGILAALYHREATGEGQYIDVSIQEASIRYTGIGQLAWDLLKKNVAREGPFYISTISWTRLRLVWECKDGYVAFFTLGGRMGAHWMVALVSWMDSEGMADDYMKQIDWWDAFDVSKVSQDMIDRVGDLIQRFFLTRTKAELVSEAENRGIQLFAVATMNDIVEDEQLAFRDFWVNLPHPELNDTISYPGAFVQASETPLTIERPAPTIGEHNQDVYGEMGLSNQDLTLLKQSGVI